MPVLGSPINSTLILPLIFDPFSKMISSPPISYSSRASFIFLLPYIDGYNESLNSLAKLLFYEASLNYLISVMLNVFCYSLELSFYRPWANTNLLKVHYLMLWLFWIAWNIPIIYTWSPGLRLPTKLFVNTTSIDLLIRPKGVYSGFSWSPIIYVSLN